MRIVQVPPETVGGDAHLIGAARRPEGPTVTQHSSPKRIGRADRRSRSWPDTIRPMWVIFDLNGTLVDPGVLLDPPELGVAALDEANMMAMVTVLAGRETEFKPLLDAALRRGLERAGRDPELAEGALERLPSMPAYPDVPEALARLREGGLQLAVLTQSSVDSAEAVLTTSGLRS